MQNGAVNLSLHDLTAQQKAVYEEIARRWRLTGFPHTIGLISHRLNLKTTAVRTHLLPLSAKGLIEVNTEGREWMIRPTGVAKPMEATAVVEWAKDCLKDASEEARRQLLSACWELLPQRAKDAWRKEHCREVAP